MIFLRAIFITFYFDVPYFYDHTSCTDISYWLSVEKAVQIATLLSEDRAT